MKDLLDLRTNTENDLEPPVTLIHGVNSEQCLRKTLTRIKIQQKEEMEAAAALAAKEAAERGEEENEEDEEE